MDQKVSQTYDFIVVGGGTAGAVVANRLSANSRHTVGLFEWGPSDEDEPRALQVLRCHEMMESEFDLDYRSVTQQRGNSHIRQARAKILGGCSSHNTMISFRPLRRDLDEWETLGASGWSHESFGNYYSKLAINVVPVAAEHRNPYLKDAINSASQVLAVPIRESWNSSPFEDGVGFLDIGYYPESGRRSSASVAYLHGVMGSRDNLDVILNARVLSVTVDSAKRARGIVLRRPDGSVGTVEARCEIVLCCGAIDTPRLLLLSGIGPGAELQALGMQVVHDLPGVGKNLIDHPEGLVLWEARRPVPPIAATGWDAAALMRTRPGLTGPDVMIHLPLRIFAMHSERLGYKTPEWSIQFAPNVTKPASRGRIWLSSRNPDEPPAIDYGYFTDEEGQDERTFLEGIRLARRIPKAPGMADWALREIFPGEELVADGELSELARAAHNTVYHVCGTCRMGAERDELAVVDPSLKVRGLRGIRIADASIFPTITTINPVVTVMMVAERAADLLEQANP